MDSSHSKGKQNSLKGEKMLNLTHSKKEANKITIQGIFFFCQNGKN